VTTQAPRRRLLWPLLLVGVMFLLATVYPATKELSRSLPPLLISAFRYCFALVALLPFYLAERRRKPIAVPRRDAVMMALLGLLGVALFSFCLTAGVRLSTAGNGSLLTNTQPIFTTLLAPLIIRDEFSPSKLAGAVLGVAGVVLIVTAGVNLRDVLTRDYFWGNLILVGGSIAISLQTMLLKKFVLRYGGLLPTVLTILWGCLALVISALLVHGVGLLAGITWRQWLLLAYIGVAGTALTYPLFNAALQPAGVVRAVGYKLLIPVFGILLSFILLGERPGLRILIGAAVVVTSLLIIQRSRKAI
jgi:drug/metabolite transporter (DMT)-like permease